MLQMHTIVSLFFQNDDCSEDVQVKEVWIINMLLIGTNLQSIFNCRQSFITINFVA